MIPSVPGPCRDRRRARLRLTLASALALGALTGAGCHRKRVHRPSAEETAYQFRDVFPYPAITGDGDDTTRLQPLLDGYLIYIGDKDFDAAAAEFAKVAKQHPDLGEARLLEGISLELAGHAAPAIPLLQGVVAERSQYAPAHWFLGKALFESGRHDEAMSEMRTVSTLGGLYAKEADKVLEAGTAPD